MSDGIITSTADHIIFPGKNLHFNWGTSRADGFFHTIGGDYWDQVWIYGNGLSFAHNMQLGETFQSIEAATNNTGPALVRSTVTLTNIATIPEPPALALMGLGLIGLFGVSRKRK